MLAAINVSHTYLRQQCEPYTHGVWAEWGMDNDGTEEVGIQQAAQLWPN